MVNTASAANPERDQNPVSALPPELWAEVVNNCRTIKPYPCPFRDYYDPPDKATLGALSLCSRSFRQLLGPMMWEVVLLGSEEHGWTRSLVRANFILQSVDRPSWVKYLSLEKTLSESAPALTQGDWDTIDALIRRLISLRGVCLSYVRVTPQIAAHILQLRNLRYAGINGVSCNVDCSDHPSESFRLERLRVTASLKAVPPSGLLRSLAKSNHLTGSFSHLTTLVLPRPSNAADLRFLLSLRTNFITVTSLEFYSPSSMSPSERAAVEMVPIPEDIFPNVKQLRGPLSLAKGFTNKRPIHFLSILFGQSFLTSDDVAHLSTGSVPLTTFLVYTTHFVDNCFRDIAQAFPQLEDLSFFITLRYEPRSQPWPVSDLGPLKKLRTLKLARPWFSSPDLFDEDPDMTRTKDLISTLQKNHLAITSIELNRSLRWAKVGPAWKVASLDRSPLSSEEKAHLRALEVRTE